MEFLEAIYVFFRWNYSIFNSTFNFFSSIRVNVLLYFVFFDYFYYCKNLYIWRPSFWMAFNNLYYSTCSALMQ